MRLRNIPRADDTLQAHFTVIKNPKEFRGNWTSVFGNDRPIRIEIGMGKGRFLLNMAKTYPNINFIGIERYSSVLLRAVEKFDTEEFSAPGEIAHIYLNFSDPWPKSRHAKRRLTSTEFLSRYEKVLPPQGLVEFKTDNTPLFDFSLEQVKEAGWTLQAFTYDLHHNKELNKENIMTEYEEKFSSKGNPINKLIAMRK